MATSRSTSSKSKSTSAKSKSTAGVRRKRSTKPAAGKESLAAADAAQKTATKASKKAKTAADGDKLDFGDSLTIADAAEWHQRLTDALKSSGALSFDGSDVEQVDGAGIQLLAAFVKEAATLYVAFEWCGASQVLREAAGQSGLADLLQLSETNKAA